jgi:hypothetical protein
MNLFKPSRKVLEMICSKSNKPLIQYEIYPFGEDMGMFETSFLGEVGLYEKIIHYYNDEGMSLSMEGKSRLNYQGIHHVFGETTKNWLDHSPENLNLTVGLFFGDKGVCYGFNDGGDFFRNHEVKNQLENKIFFKEFDQNSRGDTSHVGFSLLYEDADFIEVDSKKGILYLVQLKKNIIAPEGENGSSYFF